MPAVDRAVQVAHVRYGDSPDVAGQRDILMRTCRASLERFYLPESGLFARSAIWDGAAWTRTEPSPGNTANVALALYQLRRHGMATPFDPDPMMWRLIVDHCRGLDYTGIAFLLWADSIGDRRYGTVLWKTLLERLPASASQSMQLGWTLSALCRYGPVATDTGAATRMAYELYRRIAANQSAKSGLFYASGAREGWCRRRKPVTTLSSQTYPIHALASYGRVFGVTDAIDRATRCATAICRRQGPQGQWWWRYDVESGTVVEPYPVYSVNQDTAVPMALGELQRARGGRRDDTAVNRGLGWLFGQNELGQSLVDEQAGVIWRAIQPRETGFEVVREMHSYHPARCLYALCTKPL